MGDKNGFAEWGGYMDAKITKLEEQYAAASAPFCKSNLFAGISIYVNGLTNPSSDELKRIMMMYGGTYHHYERSHTTYIIASNLPDVKVRNMDTSKIISPKWVVDSVKANRVLDYTQYLLYTNQKTTQPRLNFGKAKKEELTPRNETKGEKLETIMQDLEKLNAQMRVDISKQPKSEADIIEPKRNNNTARTAVDPNFLPEFYNNSRLHHIATLGAGFKQYVTELREKHDDSIGFPARLKLRELLHSQGISGKVATGSSYVMHIDMDCFFVSVGLRKYPHLRGQPVAVTHSKGGSSATDVPVHPSADRKVERELFAKRFEQHLHNNILADKVRNGFDANMSLSEIASCSYEARDKGIRNGMFVGKAIKLCPELKTIPYDFEGYKEVAFTLYDTIAQYTLQIEAVSCDEMFVELSDVIRELNVEPMEFVRAIRAEVREKTGCPCSAGVGANKLQARMATKRAKPDGQYHLVVNNVESYMTDILAEELPGVGSSTNYILKKAGYITCGDLQRLTLAKLQSLVGKKHGETLYQFCRGIDQRPLSFEQARKSVSAEVNYGIRFKEYAELEKFLRQLCVEVHSRLTQINRKTKCVTLKVMIRAKEAPLETSKFMGHGVCDNITKSVGLSDFTNDVEVITRSVLSTMKNLKLPPNELRGIGIQLTKLDEQKAIQEPKGNILKNMFNKLSEKHKEEEKGDGIDQKGTKSTEKDVPALIEVVNAPSVKTAVNKRPNVFGMLQDAHLKRQKALNESSEPEAIVLPTYIDAEVFKELPLDIRKEILKDIGKTKEKKAPHSSTIDLSSSSSSSSKALVQVMSNNSCLYDQQPSTSRAAFKYQEERKNKDEIRIKEDFLKEIPADLRHEIEADIPEINNTVICEADTIRSHEVPSEMNVFLQPNCNELLLEWVKSDSMPREYDINLCREHAREMVRENQLSILYDPLIYLRKIIESKHSLDDNPWFKAYCDILKSVHHEVNLLHPGRKLFTRDTKLL